jgi:sugar phosphate isomerase/epimerase
MRELPEYSAALGVGMDRRRFLGAAGAALAAAALPAAAAFPAPGEARAAAPGRALRGTEHIERVGVQLYTIRGEMERDFAGSLAHVARIGYREVEFAGYFGHTPAQVHELLEANGLTAPGAHVALERLRTELGTVIEEAKVVGHDYIVCPALPEKERDPDGYAHLVEALHGAGKAARPAGVGIAYHNHNFDFAPFPDGSRPYDYLLAHLDPHLVRLELDLFWAFKGGADPLDLFRRAPGRFPMVHVKDMDAAGGMTDVGKGTIDWARIFGEHRRAGIQHYFVEHDEPADPWATVTASYEYLRQLTFAAAA